jgi:hypothetical protein
VYVTERASSRARREVAATSGIPFTLLHALEISNALRVLAGRRVLDTRELRGLLAQIAEDREQARLVEARIDVYAVFGKALTLSAAHAAKVLCRSLDLLHVAAALEIGARRFVSGDARQLKLASLEGFEVVDVTKRGARPRR